MANTVVRGNEGIPLLRIGSWEGPGSYRVIGQVSSPPNMESSVPVPGPESNSVRALGLRKETLVWGRNGVRVLRQMLHFREGALTRLA